MSSLSQEFIITKNNIINNNLSKIKKKISLIKTSFEEDEEDSYDQIYCKINIYFTSLINKIRLKYLEAIEHYKNIINQYEKDILNLIMENMLLKIENNYFKENENKKVKKNISKIKNTFSYSIIENNSNKNLNFKKFFYRSQDNINNIKNKSEDFLIKYNKNKKFILKRKNHSSTNKIKNKKNTQNKLEKKYKIESISNKSSNQNLNSFHKKKNSDISKISLFPLSYKKNKKSFILDEMEQNLNKHKTTQSHCNIRKIKDEMDSIINKKKYFSNKRLENEKNNYNNNVNAINDNSVEEIEKYSFDENSKYINHINNNMSNNIIHNTSINIFNTSKGLYSLNNINNFNYKNVKIQNRRPLKIKINSKNKVNYTNEMSLKNFYNNLQTKKKVFNNIKLNNNNNNKKEENIENKKKIPNIKINLFNNNSYSNFQKDIKNENKDSYNFQYLNLPFNKRNNLISRNNNINSLYSNSSNKLNSYSNFYTENSQGDLDENIDNNFNKKFEKNKILNDNIISITKKNNFIQRNKSFNCLLKTKNIIDKNNNSKNKKQLNKKNFEENHLRINNNKFFPNINNNYITYQTYYN